MQLNDVDSGREGLDDSNHTTNVYHDVDLESHLKTNGLSDQAFSKVAEDVASGDINAKMLMNCGENELNEIADSYKFTWVQKKTFINAVKLLNGHNNGQKQFIYVSSHEQSILDQIHQLSNKLKQYENKCMEIQQDNTSKLELEILKLQEYNKLIQIAFDNAIKALIFKCRNEINTNDKKYKNLQNKINKESNDLKMYQTQFEQHLSNKAQEDKNTNIEENGIFNGIKQIQSNVNRLLYHDDEECDIVLISIENELNVDQFISQFVDKINDSFCINTKIKSTQTQEMLTQTDHDDYNDETKEMATDISNMINESKDAKNQQQASNDHDDTINDIDWKFNFHYDCKNRGSKIHAIENNGKTMKCDYKSN